MSDRGHDKDVNERNGNVKCSEFGWSTFMVVSSRTLYVLHLLLTVWRVTVYLGSTFWYIAFGLIFIAADTVFVLYKRKAKEWTWFQPLVLFYLLMELPSIWILELYKASKTQYKYNSTVILGNLFKPSDQSRQDFLTDDIWAQTIEQSMLVVLIIARWMMPKGDLTRDQLAGMLLMYLGMACDIVDFFGVMGESEELLLSRGFYITILSVWSWSMCQFIFVTSVVNTDKDDDLDKILQKSSDPEAIVEDVEQEEEPEETHCFKSLKIFVESEMWVIFLSLLLQDGPFLIVRLVCLFYYGVRSYTHYFFIAKNGLVLVLQIYRMAGLYFERLREVEQLKEIKKLNEKRIRDLIRTRKAQIRMNSIAPIEE